MTFWNEIGAGPEMDLSGIREDSFSNHIWIIGLLFWKPVSMIQRFSQVLQMHSFSLF